MEKQIADTGGQKEADKNKTKERIIEEILKIAVETAWFHVTDYIFKIYLINEGAFLLYQTI